MESNEYTNWVWNSNYEIVTDFTLCSSKLLLTKATFTIVCQGKVTLKIRSAWVLRIESFNRTLGLC